MTDSDVTASGHPSFVSYDNPILGLWQRTERCVLDTQTGARMQTGILVKCVIRYTGIGQSGCVELIGRRIGQPVKRGKER